MLQVLHRDLKSANILLAEAGTRFAIADFGLARYQVHHARLPATPPGIHPRPWGTSQGTPWARVVAVVLILYYPILAGHYW